MSSRGVETFDPFTPLAERDLSVSDPQNWESWCRAFDIYADIANAKVHAFPDRPKSAIPSPPGALLGSYKDLIAVEMLKSRFGSDAVSIVPDCSAPIVSYLERNGLYTLGKVRTSEFGIGENNHSCVNPLFQDFTTSGASNGSATAVAAGLSDLSIGTDAAGSVRRPAVFCGSVGLLLSRSDELMRDVMRVSPTFDRLGLIARSCDDLAYAWDRCKFSGIFEQSQNDQNEVRFGVPELPGNVDPEIAMEFRRHIDRVRAEGWIVNSISYPLFEHRRSAWTIIAYETLQRFRMLQRCLHSSWILPNSRLLLERAENITVDQYQEALGIHTQASQNIERLYTEENNLAIILPIEPTPAPLIRIPPAVNMFPLDVDRLSYSILANLYDLIGISYPIAVSRTGYPIGIQMLAQQKQEKKLIDAARRLNSSVPQWMNEGELLERRSTLAKAANLAKDRVKQDVRWLR